VEITNKEEDQEDIKETQDLSYSNKGFEFLSHISDPQEKAKKIAKKKEVEELSGWDFEIDINSEAKSPEKETKVEEKPVIQKAKGPAKISSLPKKVETTKSSNQEQAKKTENTKIKELRNPFGKDKKTQSNAIMSVDDFFNET